MITIKIFGLDPYMLTEVSNDITIKLAQLYEVKKDEISFISSEGVYLHEGVDQTSYNVYVEVNAPHELEVLEEDAFKIITNYLKLVAINIKCVFYYFEAHHFHSFNNEEYPSFLKDIETTSEFNEDEEEVLEDLKNDKMPSDDDLFLGNAFEGFEDKLKK